MKNMCAKKILWCVASLSLMMSAISSHALTAWWAWGEIEFVQQSPGNFVIGLTTAAADGCQYDRIYLYDSELGEATVQRAVSMALAAQAAGREMGFVIDLDKRNAGLRCHALGNMIMR